MTDSPLLREMAENGTEAGAGPLTLGAEEWVARLAELPLAFHPGEVLGQVLIHGSAGQAGEQDASLG